MKSKAIMNGHGEVDQSVHPTPALDSGNSGGRSLASLDADLLRVISSWEALPTSIRLAVMDLVETVNLSTQAPSSAREHGAPHLRELAWQLAHECRHVILGCLREEEWPDADREFHSIIEAGLKRL
jgi:hypothetical protein